LPPQDFIFLHFAATKPLPDHKVFDRDNTLLFNALPPQNTASPNQTDTQTILNFSEHDLFGTKPDLQRTGPHWTNAELDKPRPCRSITEECMA